MWDIGSRAEFRICRVCRVSGLGFRVYGSRFKARSTSSQSGMRERGTLCLAILLLLRRYRPSRTSAAKNPNEEGWTEMVLKHVRGEKGGAITKALPPLLHRMTESIWRSSKTPVLGFLGFRV